VTVRIDQETIKKYIERGDFKCLDYIRAGGKIQDKQVITHVIAVFKRIAESESKGTLYKDREIVEAALDFLGFDEPIFRDVIIASYVTDTGVFKDYQTIVPACSKIRTLYNVPENACASCIFSTSANIVDAVMRAITDITLRPDIDRVVVTINSQRTGMTTFVSYKFSDIINYKMQSTITADPRNKSWERVGRPVREVIKLYELAYGHLPIIPQIVNADTLRLWDYILDNMEVEVEDTVDVQRRIINFIESGIPPKLDEVLPGIHIVTPTFLRWYYEEAKKEGRTLLSPVMVLKKVGNNVHLWIYATVLRSEIRGQNAAITDSTITSVITSMGGVPRRKLGTRVEVWRNLRGYEIPVKRLPGVLAERLEQLYEQMESLYKTKLGLTEGKGERT